MEMRESMYNILICDDEKDIVNALKIYLNDTNYHFLEAFDGEEAVHMVETNEVHLVLMDIMMPKLDGIQAMIRIREKSNVPVILLTAKGEDSDKVLGLEVGADDYVTKPFNPVELLARVKSQLRRYMQLGGGETPKDKLVIGGIELDDKSKQVTLDGEVMPLTPTEYDILKLLMQNVGKVFSTKEIYRAVWKEDPMGAEGSVAVHIRHLREKIEINPSDPRYIKVIWGRGYKMEVQ